MKKINPERRDLKRNHLLIEKTYSGIIIILKSSFKYDNGLPNLTVFEYNKFNKEYSIQTVSSNIINHPYMSISYEKR